MVRRAVFLIAAFALAFAPVSLDACEASCAWHAATAGASPHAHAAHDGAAAHPAGHQHADRDGVHHHGVDHHEAAASAALASSTHAGHACHDGVTAASSASSDNGAGIDGLPHACGHDDALASVSGTRSPFHLVAPAILEAGFVAAPVRLLSAAAAPAARPPDTPHISLSLPIRV